MIEIIESNTDALITGVKELFQEYTNRLYKSLGFYDIEPYRHTPIDDAMYPELAFKATV